jgi:hypothetical protein
VLLEKMKQLGATTEPEDPLDVLLFVACPPDASVRTRATEALSDMGVARAAQRLR